jgi:hypothetical protein
VPVLDPGTCATQAGGPMEKIASGVVRGYAVSNELLVFLPHLRQKNRNLLVRRRRWLVIP